MSNIKFNYLYRDGGNYKKFAHVVFSNEDEISVPEVTSALRSAFLEDGLFIAHQVHVPEIFLGAEDQITLDDHCFHEFDMVETATSASTDRRRRSIREFIAEVASESRQGWDPFDPQHRSLLRK